MRSIRPRHAISSFGLTFAAVFLVFGVVTASAATPCDPIEDQVYVALGDSYSSGYGLNDASGDCSRSAAQSYPKVLRNRLDITSFTDVSCGGARTAHFFGPQDSSPPQLEALDADVDLVTFSIGGNDLGFSSIAQNCALQGDCRNTYGGPTMPDLIDRIHNEVGPQVENAINAVVAAAPNAQVFVIGYPDLLPAGPTGSSWTFSCIPTSLGISDGERTALRGMQAELNAEIGRRANAVGGPVTYVDVYTPSIGHDLCSSQKWTADISTLFHPTVLGHSEMAALLEPAVRQGFVDACEAMPDPAALSGRVLDPEGQPVAGAEIWAYSPGDGWLPSNGVATDSNGAYELDVPAGTYRLGLRPQPGAGWRWTWYDSVTIDPAAPQSGVDLSYQPGGEVSGAVTGLSGPLADALVWVYSGTDSWLGTAAAITGADGSFLIEGVPVGTYRVFVWAPSGSGLVNKWWGGATRPTATQIEIEGGSQITDVNVAY